MRRSQKSDPMSIKRKTNDESSKSNLVKNDLTIFKMRFTHHTRRTLELSSNGKP